MSKTRVITVSGSGHGAGKTLVVEKLLSCFSRSAAIKASVGTEEELEVVTEEDDRTNPGKDTGRYLRAGASRAYFVSGPRDGVLSAIRQVITSRKFDVVVVETNSLARSLEAELRIFVRGQEKAKPGAEECERLADIVVCAISKEDK